MLPATAKKNKAVCGRSVEILERNMLQLGCIKEAIKDSSRPVPYWPQFCNFDESSGRNRLPIT